MATRPLVTLVLVAVLGGHPFPEARASQDDSGSIVGTVECRGAASCDGAIIYVDAIAGRRFDPGPVAIMDQRALRFVPHVMTVLVGTTVRFPNSDDLRHNVFSASSAKLFNLGLYEPGVVPAVTFDRPGVVELLCHVHPEMSAYIVVTETPYVARVERSGRFRLRGVPAGTYQVRAWREQLGEQQRQVTVKIGTATEVHFQLRP